MAEKRQTVNRIIAILSNLDAKLGNITQVLEFEVFQVRQFVQLYLQLGTITQTVRHTVWQANSYMEHIQLQLNMLLLGHMPPSLSYPEVKKHY